MEIELSGPSKDLPHCSTCGRPVDGVVVFAVAADNRVTHMYEAQCHDTKVHLVKLDGIDATPAITDERHRNRMRRWDPFPVAN